MLRIHFYEKAASFFNNLKLLAMDEIPVIFKFGSMEFSMNCRKVESESISVKHKKSFL
jgi:hypothetical protein